MQKFRLFRGALGASLLTAAGLFLSSGCSTPPPRDLMAEAAATGERPVAMKGEAKFFNSQLVAVATISRGFGQGRVGGRGDDRQKLKRRDVDPNIIAMGIQDPTEQISEEKQHEMYEDMMRVERWRRAGGSPMPPVTIRVKVHNQSAAPMTVEILEVNSYLGNFAVRPAQLTLPANEAGELEPMISQLGVTSDEVPLKVVLRVNGQKETQTIPVKTLFTALKNKP